VDDLRTTTSYFDKGWNAFVQQKDGSTQWIPEQIVGIGEDFHSQVDDGKVKTTVCRVRWRGYDRTGDTWEPITHLQRSRNHMKKMLRDWLLTVDVRQNQKQHMLSKTLPTQGSRSSTSDQHASTLTIHNCVQSVYSCVRLHDMKTDMQCVVQSKVRSELGFTSVT
jgi:hypothetical protein